ncbi:MAG: alpha/beta fold hydrolase [Candidatus Heimdallarchaeota archaeon]|nr:alpha/beta fold hydrolase [Candidatus Heimdallarchaeota archaeon]MCK5142429.1 alpha/beta fold hydrolase [Candidatus Heimdallarchaeota archaeon]
MRKRNIILVSVFAFLIVSGSVVCFIVIPFVGKSTMLYPDKEEMKMYPQELGMSYENITFSTSDSLDLKGWFVDPINTTNPNANTTMIVLHGATHAKDWMLEHYGQGLYDQGYRLFFFDSRNRGESPDTELGLTWGIDEVKDVRAAVDYVKAQPEVNASAVVLFAESQGAATILFYTAQYNDVAAIIADSSWAYGDLMIKQAYPRRSGFPWVIFGQITIALLEGHYGFTFADISPANEAHNITIPTYIIHGNADLDINPEDSTIIYNELPGTTVKLLWRVDGREHVEAYLEPDYFDRITQFISDNL